MPPSRVFHRESDDRLGGGDRQEEEIPPPPPNQDASHHVLAGISRLLEQHVGNAAMVRPEVVYEWFKRMDPEDFSGTTDSFVAKGWTSSLEGDASLWWERADRGLNLVTLTLEDFNRLIFEKYFTADVRSRLKREFMSLHRGDSSVADFVQNFDKGSFRFEKSLKDIKLEMQRKRNLARLLSQQNKRPFTCLWFSGKCFKCREQGHIALNFPMFQALASERAYVMHAKEAELDTTLITGRIRLESVATNALLYFGATHSFISESFVSHLKVTTEQLNLGFRVMVPSGEEMLSSRVVSGVELEIKGYSIGAYLIVLPIPEFNIILGMDWLVANGASIDFRRRTVSFNPVDGESFLFEAARSTLMLRIIS
ncbi:uncharacterized protein LOC142521883 [Primulina tabacum]|uniref:uncharacterized protein LOC142521883 n=1 Tax=Primulina tabacum TaxID=48773 RepID=UPI003F595A98